MGGVGLASALVGGLPLYATYGSGKVVVPGVHLAVGGTGLIMASWWTDIWSAAGGDRLGGRPRALPGLAVELAALWQHDAYVGERALLAPAVEARRGRWAGRASGLIAVDGGLIGGRVDVEARPWAALTPLAPARHTGSALAVRGALQLHGEDDQGFTLATGELSVRGRLALARLDPRLAGSFVELDEGLGLEVARYHAAGHTDVGAILLSRFAWGVYLPGGRGEVSVFYDHRRDHLAGGFPAGPAAGFFGSVGATADVVVARGWVALAQLEVGSATITTLGLRREVR